MVACVCYDVAVFVIPLQQSGKRFTEIFPARSVTGTVPLNLPGAVAAPEFSSGRGTIISNGAHLTVAQRSRFFYRLMLCVAPTMPSQDLSVCPSHAGILSKRLYYILKRFTIG